jgi:hypothetical protein
MRFRGAFLMKTTKPVQVQEDEKEEEEEQA